MLKLVLRTACVVGGLWASAVCAAPINLKLSLVTSDRSLIYLGCVKPFVDAVNAEAAGLLEIEVFFSGALEKQWLLQPDLVADGKADIAFVFPGYTPERFNGNTVVELPGLFRNTREASLVYTRLISSGAMKGYEDYFVIAALASPLESIHGRRPIESLADLNGMTVRTNNQTESTALAKLGMVPMQMPVNAVAESLSAGKIDASTAPLAMLFEFGIGRVANTHYMLDISTAPLALVMNRTKFDSLPQQARDIIRKYSGEWPVNSYLRAYHVAGDQAMEQLRANPRRRVVEPNAADLATADAAFQSVVDEWAANTPGNRTQLEIVRAELARLRSE